MSDMDKRLVPSKSALGDFFRPDITTDRFAPVSSLKKQAPRTTMTIDAHSGNNVIADIVNGSVVKSYVTPMLDQNISFTDVAGSTTYYYNQDERQSVRSLTDSSAAVAQSYDYTAYGDKIDALTSGSVTQRYTYTGRELNEASNNYYFRYRMYGAGLGGFLSRDPLGYVDGISMYAGYFARVMALDPEGTEKKSCCRAFGDLQEAILLYSSVSAVMVAACATTAPTVVGVGTCIGASIAAKQALENYRNKLDAYWDCMGWSNPPPIPAPGINPPPAGSCKIRSKYLQRIPCKSGKGFINILYECVWTGDLMHKKRYIFRRKNNSCQPPDPIEEPECCPEKK